jgi:hypothetical protein
MECNFPEWSFSLKYDTPKGVEANPPYTLAGSEHNNIILSHGLSILKEYGIAITRPVYEGKLGFTDLGKSPVVKEFFDDLLQKFTTTQIHFSPHEMLYLPRVALGLTCTPPRDLLKPEVLLESILDSCPLFIKEQYSMKKGRNNFGSRILPQWCAASSTETIVLIRPEYESFKHDMDHTVSLRTYFYNPSRPEDGAIRIVADQGHVMKLRDTCNWHDNSCTLVYDNDVHRYDSQDIRISVDPHVAKAVFDATRPTIVKRLL